MTDTDTTTDDGFVGTRIENPWSGMDERYQRWERDRVITAHRLDAEYAELRENGTIPADIDRQNPPDHDPRLSPEQLLALHAEAEAAADTKPKAKR